MAAGDFAPMGKVAHSSLPRHISSESAADALRLEHEKVGDRRRRVCVHSLLPFVFVGTIYARAGRPLDGLDGSAHLFDLSLAATANDLLFFADRLASCRSDAFDFRRSGLVSFIR